MNTDYFRWQGAPLRARRLVATDVSAGRGLPALPSGESDARSREHQDRPELGRSRRPAAGAAPVRLALNAVGGDSAVRMAGALAPGGTIVTFGAMARQPLKVPNGLLIFQDIAWRGFWITHWYEQVGAATGNALLAELASLVTPSAR